MKNVYLQQPHVREELDATLERLKRNGEIWPYKMDKNVSPDERQYQYSLEIRKIERSMKLLKLVSFLKFSLFLSFMDVALCISLGLVIIN